MTLGSSKLKLLLALFNTGNFRVACTKQFNSKTSIYDKIDGQVCFIQWTGQKTA